MNLNIFSHEFAFPARQEPDWGPLVERWYQLDAPAYGLAETYWRHRERLLDKPLWILLCSPSASNATDAQFALAAQPSPAKFVHTLPNIRSAALLQVMKWSGPVLCIQNDPNTILTGLGEAFDLAEEGPVWVVSAMASEDRAMACIFTVDSSGMGLKIRKTDPGNLANQASHDKQWLTWISNSKSQPFQGSGLWIG